MLAADQFVFKKFLRDRGVIFSFSGYISEGILFSLGEALKQKMMLDETDTNTVKKVFSVFVEQVQNIIRYSADKSANPPTELSSGIVTVGVEESRFFVVCANTVLNSDVEGLCKKLSDLQKMDKEELKAFYRKKLKEPVEEDARGGGIGLIEIARRASEPIEFDFIEIENELTFFCIKAYI